MITHLAPNPTGASADTMIEMMRARIPNYKAPSAAKKGKKGGKGKGEEVMGPSRGRSRGNIGCCDEIVYI